MFSVAVGTTEEQTIGFTVVGLDKKQAGWMKSIKVRVVTATQMLQSDGAVPNSMDFMNYTVQFIRDQIYVLIESTAPNSRL